MKPYLKLFLLLCITFISTAASAQRKYYDALAFGFKGHVKSVTKKALGKEEAPSTYVFNAQGALISLDGEEVDPASIRRDEHHRLMVRELPSGSRHHWAYENGLLYAEAIEGIGMLVMAWTWDKKKQITKCEIGDARGNVAATVLYKTLQVDARGNATKKTTLSAVADGSVASSTTYVLTYTYWK